LTQMEFAAHTWTGQSILTEDNFDFQEEIPSDILKPPHQNHWSTRGLSTLLIT
ncbi:FAM149A isoform 4, partial [Pan troglodytes]